MPNKQLLAAGIVRDIQFRNYECLEIYLYGLERFEYVYQILDRYDREDGSIIIRILQQYNRSPLIDMCGYCELGAAVGIQ